MKQITIGRYTYKIIPAGYGQYQVRRETKRTCKQTHSTDSQMYDWIDDASDPKKNREARHRLVAMFRRAAV